MPYKVENRALSFTANDVHGLTTLPHIHSHLELVYLTEGATVATVDYQEFYAEKGDLFLSFPNQIHYYHDCGPTSGYLIIFSPELFRELGDVFQKKVPVSPVLKKKYLNPETLDILERILVKNKEVSQFSKIAAKGWLLALLGEILPSMPMVPKPSSNDNIKNILTYCSENYQKPLTLDSLATELHMNKYYISHIFKERMEISFSDFINGLRVEHACELLEKNSSNITEVAFASGFSSIRTFNRAFAKKMCMSPREYICQLNIKK